MEQSLYPLKFKSLYSEKIWGGRELAAYKEDLPQGSIGESWEVACSPNKASVVANGPWTGLKLDELIEKKGEVILGSRIPRESFPLLVKILNTNGKLSVQVHPDKTNSKDGNGKNEAWYIIDAESGSCITAGLKDPLTREQLIDALEEGCVEAHLNVLPIKRGELYYIESGLVHSISGKAIILEVQQNCDITYRFYDYDSGRELHIENALNCLKAELHGYKGTGVRVEGYGYNKTYLLLTNDFSLELYEINEKLCEHSDRERFYVFSCVEGEGTLAYAGGSEVIRNCQSVLVPAYLGEYCFSGRMKLVKCYVPDVSKVIDDIVRVIRK